MSNRQLPWDDKRIRDRISPREIDDQDKEQMRQQDTELHDHADPQSSKDDVIDSNPGSHSKKDHK